MHGCPHSPVAAATYAVGTADAALAHAGSSWGVIVQASTLD